MHEKGIRDYEDCLEKLKHAYSKLNESIESIESIKSIFKIKFDIGFCMVLFLSLCD